MQQNDIEYLSSLLDVTEVEVIEEVNKILRVQFLSWWFMRSTKKILEGDKILYTLEHARCTAQNVEIPDKVLKVSFKKVRNSLEKKRLI